MFVGYPVPDSRADWTSPEASVAGSPTNFGGFLTAPRSVALALLSRLTFAFALLPSPRRRFAWLSQHKSGNSERHRTQDHGIEQVGHWRSACRLCCLRRKRLWRT